uniref:Uncharacterized protein n=1 Tax=Glossina palpalis gambiensis TaxID=67801 RepID=A0A1B0AZS5_9MUSC
MRRLLKRLLKKKSVWRKKNFVDSKKVLHISMIDGVLLGLRRMIHELKFETVLKISSTATSPGSTTGRSTRHEMVMPPKSIDKTPTSSKRGLLDKFLEDCGRIATKDCEVHNENYDGPSTSAQAVKQSNHSKFARLTGEDRIVQVHFDEAYTNLAAVYSRADDAMGGCDYSNKKKRKTMEHQRVLVFAAHSLLTPFNVVLNSYPRTTSQKKMGPVWT